jgi:ribosomal protein S30
LEKHFGRNSRHANIYKQLTVTICYKTNQKSTPTIPRSQKKTWKSQRKNKIKYEKDKEEEQGKKRNDSKKGKEIQEEGI